MIRDVIDRVVKARRPEAGDLQQLLDLTDQADIETLFDAAYEAKIKNVDRVVYFRGIVELSNVCDKDCYYCGIRRSNRDVQRFTMKQEEILDAAKWANRCKYGSIVLQAGERTDPQFVGFVESMLLKIRRATKGKLGITLSLGEQAPETYRRWFNAGAHRYLLRIETSQKKLYRKLHPSNHSFDARCSCLAVLRDIGFQVGTGVMIGLPGQSTADMADDVLYFHDVDVDMIGMGPYLPHEATPIGKQFGEVDSQRQLELGLKMIAITRLTMPDINIAATTALQGLDAQGREKGLKAGANVIMPNLTPTKYRTAYQLYNGKPCLDENAKQCRSCLERRIEGIGESIGLGQWGDSPHFLRKGQKKAFA